MLFNNTSIHTIHHIAATQTVLSTILEERIKTTLNRVGLAHNLLERVSGIHSRHFWNPPLTPSQASTKVAEATLAKSDLPLDAIDALICTGVTKDFIEPSMASMVHHKLGLRQGCINFDLTNACLGFLNAMQVAAGLIESGQVRHVLIVAAECIENVVEETMLRLEQETANLTEVREEFATLTLGSGAVAMVMSQSNLATNGHRIVSCINASDTSKNLLCTGQNNKMRTQAGALMEAGVALGVAAFQTAKKELNWEKNAFDEYAIHQVSRPNTAALLTALGIAPHKVMTNFQEHGNMGPVSLPFTVSMLADSGRLTNGKRLALMGMGSGLNCMMMDVLW